LITFFKNQLTVKITIWKI